MRSVKWNRSGNSQPRQWMSEVTPYLKGNIRAIAKITTIFIVIIELGAIWNEVHQMRSEQVKNILFSMPKERRNALRGTSASKRMESSAFVDGDVTIDGTVQLDQPVEVEIDR